METIGRKKSRPRRSFTKEFKAEVVALVRQPGNTAASVARDLDLTETAVRKWVKQADIRDGLTSDERAEPARLREENRDLQASAQAAAASAPGPPPRWAAAPARSERLWARPPFSRRC